jgi:hypothetical protein
MRALRMQWLKPIQSTRKRPREALRLQAWMRHTGGSDLRTYLSARFIARFCLDMHFCCHWQATPMLSATGSRSGGRACAAAMAAGSMSRTSTGNAYRIIGR